MELALADYATFYKDRHANRKLTWAHYLGTATLTAWFASGKKELTMSLYQAIVLLLFNENTTWTVEEIAERVSLGSVFRAVLSSLIKHPSRNARLNSDDPVACTWKETGA